MSDTANDGGGRRAGLVRLWRGELPLARAFWEFAVTYGVMANLAATAAAFAALTFRAPGWLVLALFLAPLPYTIMVVVGVFRSAARHAGSPRHADLARVGVIVLAVLLTLL